MNYYIFLIFLIVLNFLFLNKLNYFATIMRLMDYPEGKLHSHITPKFGLFMFSSILLITLFKNYKIMNFENYLVFIYLNSFLIIGYLDDRYNLSIKIRFFFGLLITFIFFYLHNNYFVSIDINFETNLIILILFSLGFLHLINMTDGLNGLVLTLFLYTCIYFALKGYQNYGEFSKDLTIYSLICSLIYLIPNFLGKCFLGNTGSYCLAIIISILYMELFKISVLEYSDIILIFIVPLFDGVRVSITRIFNNKNPFKGDHLHLHHIIREHYQLKIIYFFLIFLPSSINFFYKNFSLYIGLMILLIYLFFFLYVKLQYKPKKLL